MTEYQKISVFPPFFHSNIFFLFYFFKDKIQSIHPTKTNYSKRSDLNGGLFDKISFIKPLPKENKVF